MSSAAYEKSEDKCMCVCGYVEFVLEYKEDKLLNVKKINKKITIMEKTSIV